MPLDALSEAEVIRAILGELGAARGGTVLTANIELLRQHRAHPPIRSFFDASELVVPDGMPLVWASHLQGTPVAGRVAGSTLIRSLSSAAAVEGVSVFLLGGNAGVAEEAARRLRGEFPRLRIAGTACPRLPVERPGAELEWLRRLVREASPDIVFIGLPFEKQVYVINELRGLLPSAWLVGVGVGLSYVSGELPRAPVWMQQMGLEWLHRLRYQPRLYRRYLVNGIPLAARLALHALAARLRSPAPTA